MQSIPNHKPTEKLLQYFRMSMLFILCHFQRQPQSAASLLNAVVLLDWPQLPNTDGATDRLPILLPLGLRDAVLLQEAENRSQNPARLRGRGDFLTSSCVSLGLVQSLAYLSALRSYLWTARQARDT